MRFIHILLILCINSSSGVMWPRFFTRSGKDGSGTTALESDKKKGKSMFSFSLPFFRKKGTPVTTEEHKPVTPSTDGSADAAITSADEVPSATHGGASTSRSAASRKSKEERESRWKYNGIEAKLLSGKGGPLFDSAQQSLWMHWHSARLKELLRCEPDSVKRAVTFDKWAGDVNALLSDSRARAKWLKDHPKSGLREDERMCKPELRKK